MKLVIQKKEGDKDAPQKKTRQFSAVHLGHICLPLLWDGGFHNRETRPSYIVIAGTTASLGPFLANFHTKGLRADLQPADGRSSWSKARNWFRCLKSAGYEVTLQRDGESHIATLYQPSLFQVDPGLIDPITVSFVSIPPAIWCQAQADQLTHNEKAEILQHARRLNLLDSIVNSKLGFVSPFLTEDDILNLIPQAIHFGHCLDKRIKRPLISAYSFYLHLYLAALAEGIASYWHGHPWQWATHKWASSFTQLNANDLGFCSGAVVKSSHKAIDPFLEKMVATYLQMTAS